MKVVIVGASKVLVAFVVVIVMLAAAVFYWLTFGIRPFDKMTARINALTATDADQALALFPQFFDLADKDHMSPVDHGRIYLMRGRLLKSHGRFKEAIPDFEKCAELSREGWHGITRAGALLDLAQCHYELGDYSKNKSDIDNLLEAARIHPTVESGEDSWFWPDYECTIGRLYVVAHDYDNAAKHLQKDIAQLNTKEGAYYGLQSAVALIDSLVRQGKYDEANKMFIGFVSDPKFESGYGLRAGYRGSLKRADNKDRGFGERLHSLLIQKRFADLDKLADERRAAKKILPSGRWSLNEIYDSIDDWPEGRFDSDWQAHMNLLKEWVKERPDSAAAKTALGYVLVSYAWTARGGGWAQDVTDAQWKIFGERLAQARAVLDQVRDKPPEWYTASQKCALGQSMEKKQYDIMVEECRKRYPDYDRVVQLKCYWLQPRWNGQEGEYENYINGEANKRKGVAGDVLYARGAWYLDDGCIDNVMGDTKTSWPRVKTGLQEIIKEYPDSLLAKGMLSIMAMEANDRKTAEAAFAKP